MNHLATECGKPRTLPALFTLTLPAAMLVLVTACSIPTSSSGSGSNTAYKTYLYMTDSTNGHVYYYNPSTHAGSSSSLFTTSTNAAGEIAFYNGTGFIAMGYGGIYYFDPSASSPTAKLIQGSSGLDAEFFAFYSSTKAYVSVVTSYGSDTGAVYYFNPSSPSSGLTQVASSTATKYFQGITVGPDNEIYIAENQDSAVIRINPSTDTVDAAFTTNASGVTGLLSGTYNSQSGVFVANTGGSIDFIPKGSSTGTKATQICGSIYPGRLVQLSNGNLIAVGYSAIYSIALSGSTATASTLLGSPNSSGGFSYSVAYDSTNQLLYIPFNVYSSTGSATNQLYVYSTSGSAQSFSPVTVMTSADNLANVALYQ